MISNYEKTLSLLKLYLRKDRLKLLFWSLCLIICSVGIAAYFPTLYSTNAEKEAIAVAMNNPAMIAMSGVMYGETPHTIGALAAHQMLFFTTILAIIMNIDLAVKNSRQEEDNGISEMIASFSIGRNASIAALCLQLIIVDVALSVVIGLGLGVSGIEGITMFGGFVFGFAMMLVGLVFGCATVVFAQLSSNTRSTLFLSYFFFGFMYLVRASTDISNPNYSWLSIFAWANKTEVFVNNRVLPLVLCLMTSLIFITLAVYLKSNRDIGSGLLPTKNGREKASPLLNNSLALVFKLEVMSIFLWLVVIVVLAASYGSVFGDIDSFMENDVLKQVVQADGQHSLALDFIPLIMSIIAMFIVIPCISIYSKMFKEEQSGRIEQLYALPLAREKYLLDHLILTVLFSIVGLLLGSFTLWYVSAQVMSKPIILKDFIFSAFAYLPAILLMIGLTIFLLGMFARALKVMWLYVGLSFMVVFFGPLFKLPEWCDFISPFGMIPRVPIEEFNWLLFVSMIVIAALLTVLGFVGYKRRDILT